MDRQTGSPHWSYTRCCGSVWKSRALSSSSSWVRTPACSRLRWTFGGIAPSSEAPVSLWAKWERLCKLHSPHLKLKSYQISAKSDISWVLVWGLLGPDSSPVFVIDCSGNTHRIHCQNVCRLRVQAMCAGCVCRRNGEYTDCLGSGPIPKTPHDTYSNMPKSRVEGPKIQNTVQPTISDEGCSVLDTCLRTWVSRFGDNPVTCGII